MNYFHKPLFLACLLLSLAACSSNNDKDTAENEPQDENPQGLAFADDNGSIKLPNGFRAVVVADDIGQARHLVVDEEGDVYVNLGSPENGHGLVAMRDTDGDGKADKKEYFGKGGGTGIRLHNGYLYYSTNEKVFRHSLKKGDLVPSGAEELMLTLPSQNQHASKAIAFDGQGNMYVEIGAPSNACQDPDRTKGTPGQDPCPLLEKSGGIWKFSDSQTGQSFGDGERYATGIRHAVGMDWNTSDNTLYAMQHGRDQLHQFWPDLYTEQESAEMPAEEMLKVNQGDDFGWPYCYYDWKKDQLLLNPEYGGDGNKVGRCSSKEDPVIAFPGHWAPNALQFYTGRSFPQKYRNGAFVAFHGSWNRAPLPQQGYKVVFVPFSNGQAASQFENFATEFADDGSDIASPGDAEYRPCGLAVGPDGSLYICSSAKGRVWRVVYTQ